MERSGIETDSDGRPVAYWFRRDDDSTESLKDLDVWYQKIVAEKIAKVSPRHIDRMRADWERFMKIKES